MFWRYIFFEFSITNQRIVSKSGFLLKSTDEMRLEKIETVKTRVGLLGFIFSYGKIVITGSGGTKIYAN